MTGKPGRPPRVGQRLPAASALSILGLGLGAALIAAAAIGGCSPTPSRPTVVSAAVETPDGAASHFPTDVTAGGMVAVGTGPFTVTIQLDPPPDQTWIESNLKTSEQPVAENGPSPLSLSFARDDHGRDVEVSLSSVRLPKGSEGGNVFSLRFRREPPTATVAIRTGGPEGKWRPFWGRPEQGPFELKVAFSSNACRSCAEQALGSLGAQMTWPDDLTLVLSFAAPPADLDIPALHDSDGLYYDLNTAPLLVAYDPVSGLETPVCEVIENVYEAFLSPEAGRLLAKCPAADSDEEVTWVIDTATGTRLELDPALECGWIAPDSLVRVAPVPGGGMGYKVVDVSQEAPSVLGQGLVPDSLSWWSPCVGSGFLMVYCPDDAAASADYLTPCDVYLIRLDTGAQTVIPHFVSVLMPPTEGAILGKPAFSPDGLLVAAPGDSADGGEILVARPGDGTAEIVETVPLAGTSHLAWDYFSWSPDGRWWFAGGKLVDTAPPHEAKELPISDEGKPYTHGKPYWSPDGKWLALGAWPDWGTIELLEVDTGTLLDLGDGFPCGWDTSGKFYLIRWPGFENRRRPQWG